MAGAESEKKEKGDHTGKLRMRLSEGKKRNNRGQGERGVQVFRNRE